MTIIRSIIASLALCGAASAQGMGSNLCPPPAIWYQGHEYKPLRGCTTGTYTMGTFNTNPSITITNPLIPSVKT